MPIIDISVTLSPELPLWPGDGSLAFERILDIGRGDGLNVTRMSGPVHVGTHVDAPLHFVADGAGVDELDLEVLIGPAAVVEALEVDSLGAAELEALPIPPGTRRLLLKTRNSEYWARGESEFQRDYVGIEASGAEWLVARGVRLIGIDYLSVAAQDATQPTHTTLLRAGVVALEGLDLSRVQAGIYQLVCLPIKIGGCDGAPARAVLLQ